MRKRSTEKRIIPAHPRVVAGEDAGALEAGLAGKAVEWLDRRRDVRFAAGRFGGARVLEARVPPVRIVQPAGDPRRGQTRVHLTLHLAGAAHYRQGGDTPALQAGPAMLIDAAAPCEVIHPEGAHVVSWELPRGEIVPFLPKDAAASPVVKLTGPLAEVTADYAVSLAGAWPEIADEMAPGLIGHLAELIGLALSGARGEDAEMRAGHTALMRRRILALIEARFREPGLTSREAAHDLGMSRRWLTALLEGSGAGFRDRLAARRVEECRRLLDDPKADHLSVTEIAFASGFNDLSTFHRRFRQRFGTTPAAARARRKNA